MAVFVDEDMRETYRRVEIDDFYESRGVEPAEITEKTDSALKDAVA